MGGWNMVFFLVVLLSISIWIIYSAIKNKQQQIPPWKNTKPTPPIHHPKTHSTQQELDASSLEHHHHQQDADDDHAEQRKIIDHEYTEIDQQQQQQVPKAQQQHDSSSASHDGKHLIPSDYLNNNMVIPIVIFAYTRNEYLKRCLDKLLHVLSLQQAQVPKLPQFDIFVSQDGDYQPIIDLVKSYGSKLNYIQHGRENVQFDNPPVGGRQYYYISQHYKYGIEQVFRHNPIYDRIIILEEDIEIAPDFFDYFASLGILLDHGWNDNGMKDYVKDASKIYRSDFFPGLGWMMKRSFWDTIHDKWPIGFWDDWLRLPHVRRGRACIRPEMSRTFTFGEQGASGGQFYHQFLSRIELSQERVSWSDRDLSDMLKSHYDTDLTHYLASVPLVHAQQVQDNTAVGTVSNHVKISYASEPHFVELANRFGIMSESKSGVPRTAYLGIVTFRYNKYQVYLVPERQDLLYSNNT